jgi:hypothetical protein
MFFDSSENSAYNKLYHNKIEEGLLISIYDDGYPYINIECGSEMVVNYVNQMYFYGKEKIELNGEHLEIILEIGRIFFYREAKIYYNFKNFSEFKDDIYFYTRFYNHTLYNYAKNKVKFLDKPFIKTQWFMMEQFLNKPISIELKTKYKLNSNSLRDCFIDIVENNFIVYDKFVEDTKLNQFLYLTYEIYEQLNNENRIENFRSTVNYKDEMIDDYVFRQPIHRY